MRAPSRHVGRLQVSSGYLLLRHATYSAVIGSAVMGSKKGIMRPLLCLALLAFAGCATAPSVTPREYLDEQTAATITVVADPWIFTRKNAPPQLDFFNLYAIDVNRMGDHKKYFAVVHYWPGPELAGSGAPALVLSGGAQELKLTAASEDARQLGVAEALDKSAPSSAKTWFYLVDKERLQAIAQSRQLSATLATERVDAAYVVWRDGSSELSEFATALDR
jgi:hypothetical protein